MRTASSPPSRRHSQRLCLWAYGFVFVTIAFAFVTGMTGMRVDAPLATHPTAPCLMRGTFTPSKTDGTCTLKSQCDETYSAPNVTLDASADPPGEGIATLTYTRSVCDVGAAACPSQWTPLPAGCYWGPNVAASSATSILLRPQPPWNNPAYSAMIAFGVLAVWASVVSATLSIAGCRYECLEEDEARARRDAAAAAERGEAAAQRGEQRQAAGEVVEAAASPVTLELQPLAPVADDTASASCSSSSTTLSSSEEKAAATAAAPESGPITSSAPPPVLSTAAAAPASPQQTTTAAPTPTPIPTPSAVLPRRSENAVFFMCTAVLVAIWILLASQGIGFSGGLSLDADGDQATGSAAFGIATPEPCTVSAAFRAVAVEGTCTLRSVCTVTYATVDGDGDVSAPAALVPPQNATAPPPPPPPPRLTRIETYCGLTRAACAVRGGFRTTCYSGPNETANPRSIILRSHWWTSYAGPWLFLAMIALSTVVCPLLVVTYCCCFYRCRRCRC